MKKIIQLFVLTLLVFTFFAAEPNVAYAKKADPNDPYAFPWCMQHDGCHRFGIANQTDYWLQVYATSWLTGDEGFFTIPPGTKGFLKAQPGPYSWHFVFWCNGEIETEDYYGNALNSNWVIYFKCPMGYAGSTYGH